MKPTYVIHTFGDSVLDCARYTKGKVTPVGLLAYNNDVLFPEWKGKDLTTLIGTPIIDHRATDGATSFDLHSQFEGLDVRKEQSHIAIVSIGGNDLLTYMNPMMAKGAFEDEFAAFKAEVAIWIAPLHEQMETYILDVYDPTFGSDAETPLDKYFGITEANSAIVKAEMRRRHALVNGVLRSTPCTAYIPVYGHFMTGKPEWFSNIIEPSHIGASEIRRLLWEKVVK